jgi:hypothetical protein
MPSEHSISEPVYNALVGAIMNERVSALADAFAEMYSIAQAGAAQTISKGIDDIAVLVLSEEANG